MKFQLQNAINTRRNKTPKKLTHKITYLLIIKKIYIVREISLIGLLVF